MRLIDGDQFRLNPQDAFDATSYTRNLAGRSARGGAVALGSQGIRLAMNVASVAILARLLEPGDFGLIGMAVVVTGFAQVLRDAGLTTPTVQVPEITRDQMSTIFWVNMAVLFALGAGVVVSAPLVGLFYRTKEIVLVTAALGAVFVVNGLSVQHEALLRRHMRFASLAVAQVLSQVVGLTATATLALMEWGYWSLVAGTLVTALSSTVLILWCLPWMPDRPRRGTGAKHMLRSGTHMMAFNVINYFARNTDYMLIGRLLGSGPLGLYTKAFQVSMLPMSQIRVPVSEVALPVLSSLQGDEERFERYFIGVVTALAAVTVPIGAYFCLEGELLVRLVMGSSWMGAVPAFRVLSIAGVLQAILGIMGVVLMSLGKTRRYLWIGAGNGVVIITAFAIGVSHGITGVGAAYAIASSAVLVPTAIASFRGTPVSAMKFFSAVGRPVAYASIATLGAWYARIELQAPDTLVAMGTFVAFVGVYGVLAFADRGLRAIGLSILRSALGRTGAVGK